MGGVLLTAKGDLNNFYGELGKSVFFKIVFNNYFWIHHSQERVMLKHIWNLTFLTLENNVRNIETSSNVLSLNFLVKCFNKHLTIESTYIRLLDFIPSNMTDAERICRPGPLHDTQDESGSTSVEQEKKCLILGDSISIGYVRSMTVLPITTSCCLH